jgi:RHS repeat-associated protein
MGTPFNVDSFTGQPDQLTSDEYDFAAREMQNEPGRWISPDPMPGTGNKYAYADNNPLSKVDLNGFLSLLIDGTEFSESLDAGISGLDTYIHPGEGDIESHPANPVTVTDNTEADAADSSQQQQSQASGTTNQPQQQPAQQQKTLPDNPSGLGDGWKDVTPQGGQNPKIPKRYRGPKGTEIEFDPANPDKSPKTWGGRNHWHEVGPDGKREDGHLAPGSAMPGPDGSPAPEQRSIMRAPSQGTIDAIKRGAFVGALAVGAAVVFTYELLTN